MSMQRIILVSVLYPTNSFKSFLHDLLISIKEQTYKEFFVLFFLDGVQKFEVAQFVNILKIEQKIFYKETSLHALTPSQIRLSIIKFAYELSCDILIFCDFDEKMCADRIEKTLFLMQDNIDFTYCDAYITDSNFNLLNNKTFFQSKDIPNSITCIDPILTKNFIGMGGLALQLKKTSLCEIQVPDSILVFDWFLATHMLLLGWSGKKINDCLVYYRQHENNHIGTGKKLNSEKLKLGIQVKKNHYRYFLQYDNRYLQLYYDICKVEEYIEKNEKKYIKIIDTYFDPNTLCWWENIKTLEEIQKWI